MDILAKRLTRIADKVSEEAEDDFYYEHGISLSDYNEAKRNPIYGFLLQNEMTSDDWFYCSDSREQLFDIKNKVLEAIKSDESDESGELVKRPDGVELVSLVYGNLFDIDEDHNYVAEIDGKYRLINVVLWFKDRF